MFSITDILEYAAILELRAHAPSETRVDVELGPGITLIFENQPFADDTIIRFEGGWHSHGDIMADSLGVPVEDVPTRILEALRSGTAMLVSWRGPDGMAVQSLQFTNWISTSGIEQLGAGESIEYRRVA